jgi:hypothetical protein
MPSEQIKKRSMKEKATEELKKLAVLSVYLWVFLGVFQIYRALLLRGQVPGSELSFRTGFALVKALVLAKFMLIAETVWAAETFKDNHGFIRFCLSPLCMQRSWCAWTSWRK